jgi:hypothetical protein
VFILSLDAAAAPEAQDAGDAVGDEGHGRPRCTEGGANNKASSVYLARMPAANIATGKQLRYFTGLTSQDAPQFTHGTTTAKPLFTDSPARCAAQFGVSFNAYLGQWILLYQCNENDPLPGHPNGIFMRTADHPWGPWSAPTTIFNPEPDPQTMSGYCYFIYLPGKTCPTGTPNAHLADSQHRLGSYYGPYFVANWTTGTRADPATSTRATTTIYYTLDTFDPYGQLIMRSTIFGPPVAARSAPEAKPKLGSRSPWAACKVPASNLPEAGVSERPGGIASWNDLPRVRAPRPAGVAACSASGLAAE